MERFLQKIQATRVHKAMEDKVIWAASRCGTLSIKSPYSILELENPPLFSSGSIWRSSAPPKVALFA